MCENEIDDDDNDDDDYEEEYEGGEGEQRGANRRYQNALCPRIHSNSRFGQSRRWVLVPPLGGLRVCGTKEVG